MKAQRNDTINIIKLLAAYMVVFVHVPLPGQFGEAINALARFAVPFFFLVSGFYSYKITPQKIGKRVLHLLTLLILAGVVYAAYDIFFLVLKHQPVLPYLQQYILPQRLIKLLVFNLPIYNTHLWYMLAILYVYGLLFLATMWKIPEKWIFSLSVLALALHLLLGEVCPAASISVPKLLVRNFALFGVPFFGLGMWVRANTEKLQKISTALIIGAIALGIPATLVSRFLWGAKELYFGSVLLVFACTVLFVKAPNPAFPAKLLSLTACSTYIYLFHPLVSYILKNIYTFIGVDISSPAMQTLHAFVVCVLTTIGAYCLVSLLKKKKKVSVAAQ